MKKILFVCMGNICRSPTAEGVLRVLAEREGIDGLEVDSAGTHAYHVGEPPDPRSCLTASQRGYDLSALRARRISARDFTYFDLILAMDRDNLAVLLRGCPAEHRHKLGLFLEYANNVDDDEVPDPYYGGEAGFTRVLHLIEEAGRGLIGALRPK